MIEVYKDAAYIIGHIVLFCCMFLLTGNVIMFIWLLIQMLKEKIK